MTVATEARPAAPTRDRAIDAVRALAILGVVCGHWLVGALLADETGALAIDSPLRTLGWLAPATWLLQMLGLFFLVGGYASAPSLLRARERGETDGGWLRRRLARLGRPILGAVAVVIAGIGLAAVYGVPAGTLRTWAVLVVQPFWFIGVYALVTALTPLALRLDRRWGWRAALPLAAAVAVVDVARYGFGAPEALGYLTVVPAWMFAYQLGVTWARRGIDRRVAVGLLAGGVALFAALLVVAHYPLSMVTVPGAGRSNSNPPSLLVIALAAAQSGAAILLRERLGRLLHRRERLWKAVGLLNLFAMTVFCWHQTALVAVAAAAHELGDVRGLTDTPDGPGWVLARVGWFPVLGLVLAGLVVGAGRFERIRHASRGQRWGAGLAAAVFTVYLLAVY
jgi:peptidoglycan/LPS O-acetylase OafA/YrhL